MGKNCECVFQKCDVKNLDDVKKAVEFRFKSFGKIDYAILTGADLSEITEFEGATFNGANWWHARTGRAGL